jgi:enoyl-CoA hydratase/carnithine racemase
LHADPTRTHNPTPMTAPLIVTRREDALLYIGLNRPEKRNAIHREVLRDLTEAVAAAERERDVRAVILYGEGPVFSAGVDFGMLGGDVAGEPARPFRALVGDMQAALSRLETIEKPVIAALHRYVPGLALELALACDLRVATSDCQLGLPEVRVGLIPDVGGTTRLVRTVGYAKAKELILTGRMIDAATALAIGLVHQVVPPGEHLNAAAALGREIGANAPLAVGLAKRAIDLAADADKQTSLHMELLAQSILVRTDDAREGAEALAARRTPQFRGR